ncbi:hypothetical protein B0T26DRAFT_755894 [Lasiosphaeria miniovina]|uniref:Uncharacterized protein n=1 Tax=Lasiosphaeria miniovina TaxID=1954250 RepID=A0AA39ZZB8_9PEZI|nr:uncharacterized protein B0T26DRAFT_755894 [Lasiosphaeria miniovina]KAK0706392.1 hypothetical protein B0T26DRAFT_755894 [Lasiosphaeria miniovina]
MPEEEEGGPGRDPGRSLDPPSPLSPPSSFPSPTTPSRETREAGVESMLESAGRRRQTPPNQLLQHPPLTRPRINNRQHARSPSLPLLPSALSSPRSLHHLGIGSPLPLSPLRRQFPSPPGIANSSSFGIARDDADDELSDDNDSHGRLDVAGGDTDSSEAGGRLELDDHDNNLTQDSKDVLVQRLSDLVQRLSTAANITLAASAIQQTAIIGQLHAKVDEMEGALLGEASGGAGRRPRRTQPYGRRRRARPSRSPRPFPLPVPLLLPNRSGSLMSPSSLSSQPSGSQPANALWLGGTLTPPPPWRTGAGGQSGGSADGDGDDASAEHFTDISSWMQQQVPSAIEPSATTEEIATTIEAAPTAKPASVTTVVLAATAKTQPDVAERVAAAAEKLNADLEMVVRSLRARREESVHIHGLLVERAEAAASRILELEKDVVDLEDEISSNESELKNLRLELRAVEALSSYPAAGVMAADPDLVQSIENWRSDWAALRDKMSLRKKDRRSRRRGHVLHREGGGDDHGSTLASMSNLSELDSNELLY